MGCQRPDGVSLCQVSRVTRAADDQAVPVGVEAAGDVERLDPTIFLSAMAVAVDGLDAVGGRVDGTIASIPSCRVCWLALTWASRAFPVSLAISKVFLTVHGIGGEHDVAQSQLTDHLLGGGDFV